MSDHPIRILHCPLQSSQLAIANIYNLCILKTHEFKLTGVDCPCTKQCCVPNSSDAISRLLKPNTLTSEPRSTTLMLATTMNAANNHVTVFGRHLPPFATERMEKTSKEMMGYWTTIKVDETHLTSHLALAKSGIPIILPNLQGLYCVKDDSDRIWTCKIRINRPEFSHRIL